MQLLLVVGADHGRILQLALHLIDALLDLTGRVRRVSGRDWKGVGGLPGGQFQVRRWHVAPALLRALCVHGATRARRRRATCACVPPVSEDFSSNQTRLFRESLLVFRPFLQ